MNDRERMISAATMEGDDYWMYERRAEKNPLIPDEDDNPPLITTLVDLALADDPPLPIGTFRNVTEFDAWKAAWRNRQALRTIIREKGLSE